MRCRTCQARVLGYGPTRAIPLGNLHVIILATPRIVSEDIVHVFSSFLPLLYWPVANRTMWYCTGQYNTWATARRKDFTGASFSVSQAQRGYCDGLVDNT